MTFLDPRQVRDPHRIASLPATTHINWKHKHRRGEAHGHLMRGGDHLVTVYQARNGAWEVETDKDAVFDVGYAAERLAVPGQYRTAEDAMRAAEGELYALLCRITSSAGRR
jgi:hypothetical protein